MAAKPRKPRVLMLPAHDGFSGARVCEHESFSYSNIVCLELDKDLLHMDLKTARRLHAWLGRWIKWRESR